MHADGCTTHDKNICVFLSCTRHILARTVIDTFLTTLHIVLLAIEDLVGLHTRVVTLSALIGTR